MSRRAFTLLEMLAAFAVLGVLVAFCVQLLPAVARQRAAAAQRQAATQEAANLLERIAARPWDQLTPAALQGVGLSSEARRQLPGAKLQVDVFDPAQNPAARRIAVCVQWEDRDGLPVRPARLVAWRYRP